ncbi:hypothetical protein GCM10010124_31370 [Pilimelia terevasa]|uniref:Uncharacterized protein n=1 Tax=Pilimelia terevasa TaxID=53372 RepID=A0A8J3FLN8_9ACTN|nr:DNA-binding protein [Pilimelia terevasa]GGK36451.1 hypothetical protein GCM10010124_31370 [Pilimelia terevasa]
MSAAKGRPKGRANGWTAAQIRALGTLVDIPTAGSIFGMNRTVAYDAARRGAFPVPVMTVGKRRWVSVLSIMAVLGIPAEPPRHPSPPSTDGTTESAPST